MTTAAAEASDAGRVAWKAGVILVTAALLLTVQEYLGPRLWYEWMAYDLRPPDRHGNLDGFAWWTVWCVGGYVLVPVAVILALPGERLRDYHLMPAELLRQLPIYAGVVVVGALAGWLIGKSDAFDTAARWAADRPAGGEPWKWWALAAVQIVSLEFFFRGFLLQGLRRVMGGNAVFVMVLPFCMIHFGKPMTEALVAIALGLALGALAMRLRAIWAGVVIQLAIAWVLDPAHRGRARSVVDWDVATRALPWFGLAIAGTAAVVALLCYARARNHVVWRWIALLTIDQWKAIDAETVPDRRRPGQLDWKIGVIAVVVCVSLALQEFVGQRAKYEDWFPYDGSKYWALKGFTWWVGWRVFGYVLMPMAVIALLPGERLRDYHVSTRGFVKHLWIYALMFALILPAVFVASRTDTFRHTYPFYRLANRSAFDLWSWELMYAVQFLSLEFFFRGFLLQGLRRAIGANAIFVMVVPYCMIHYGKPMAETFGAIFAGLILGTLAMRTRSIWGGVVIHVGVAWTMDLMAIQHCPEDGRPCR